MTPTGRPFGPQGPLWLTERSASQEGADDGQQGGELETGQPQEVTGEFLIEGANLAGQLLPESVDLLVEGPEAAIDFLLKSLEAAAYSITWNSRGGPWR